MLSKQRDALAHMRNARTAIREAIDRNGTRELSVAATYLDTAILWVTHDMTIQAVVDGPAVPESIPGARS